LLEKYKKKVVPLDIPDTIFSAVHDGMQGVMESGTGRGAQVPGIIVCGKTGTVENYFHGIKQPNHSFFAAFAPRDNPRIAIMCVVENSGRFGGTYAAPIVSLMIEKYLNDTIAINRKELEERMTNTNLIPPRMLQAMKTRDSLRQVRKDSLELIQRTFDDSIQLERPDTIGNSENLPPRDPGPVSNPVLRTTTMILPDEKNNKRIK